MLPHVETPTAVLFVKSGFILTEVSTNKIILGRPQEHVISSTAQSPPVMILDSCKLRYRNDKRKKPSNHIEKTWRFSLFLNFSSTSLSITLQRYNNTDFWLKNEVLTGHRGVNQAYEMRSKLPKTLPRIPFFNLFHASEQNFLLCFSKMNA